MVGVLLSRGPDAILPKGATIEMVLDRSLYFEDTELDFANGMRRVPIDGGGGPGRGGRESGVPGIGRRTGRGIP